MRTLSTQSLVSMPTARSVRNTIAPTMARLQTNCGVPKPLDDGFSLDLRANWNPRGRQINRLA